MNAPSLARTVLTPTLTVGIHPFVVIVSVLFARTLFGVVGPPAG